MEDCNVIHVQNIFLHWQLIWRRQTDRMKEVMQRGQKSFTQTQLSLKISDVKSLPQQATLSWTTRYPSSPVCCASDTCQLYTCLTYHVQLNRQQTPITIIFIDVLLWVAIYKSLGFQFCHAEMSNSIVTNKNNWQF